MHANNGTAAAVTRASIAVSLGKGGTIRPFSQIEAG
jgi:hypothetical protein